LFGLAWNFRFLLHRCGPQQRGRSEEVTILLGDTPANSDSLDGVGIKDKEGSPKLAVLPSEGWRQVYIESVIDDDDLCFLRVRRIGSDQDLREM
jgi:hypothetical protein